ncbi:ParB-like protein [Bacteriovorax sp. BSW11_IV]|uniref:ParB/RepB/Spo0J family partition protein n=1 Tax=Bacteriovorax sp. BSW11_IV TaxID=1353529 RepID=UPI00038A19AF|nr:ParB/RepB/Spo0J family partition protein [Bacteriovorax sp. BSW11_IV]EQC48918.1 ParB-like protein [Bacteriovorax sp. BSW11_IV]
MAKKFAARVAKSDRRVIDMSDRLSRDLFKISDEKLLKGARLDEILLKDINVKEQVRTKFNDDSIKELAANIKVNGLIQPLVLHLDKKLGKYTLICGERRFRAMSSINMEKCPCFILEDKTEEELMAIQFSENSAREALHYIDKADGILNYQIATKASERKIQAALGISKSEVHRSLLIAKMDKKIKEAAKKYNIEKYVLLEFDVLDKSDFKTQLEKKILAGDVTKRSQLKRSLSSGVVKTGTKKKVTKAALPKGLSAAAFLKAMQAKQKDMNLDKETQKLLKALVQETKEIVDM